MGTDSSHPCSLGGPDEAPLVVVYSIKYHNSRAPRIVLEAYCSIKESITCCGSNPDKKKSGNQLPSNLLNALPVNLLDIEARL